VVERSVDGGEFLSVETLLANATTYTDTAVSSGVTYIYRIAAVNNAGLSTWIDSSTNPLLVP